MGGGLKDEWEFGRVSAGWPWREVGFGYPQRELLVSSCGCGAS